LGRNKISLQKPKRSKKTKFVRSKNTTANRGKKRQREKRYAPKVRRFAAQEKPEKKGHLSALSRVSISH